APWTVTVDDSVTWSTESFAQDPNANAIRWSRLYSFRFDATTPPVLGEVEIELFKVSDPQTVAVRVPSSSTLPPPTDFACWADAVGVQLTWNNGASYRKIDVLRDGVLLASLLGDATSFTDTGAQSGPTSYEVRGASATETSQAVACEIDVPPPLDFLYAELPTTIGGLGISFEFTIVESIGGEYQPGTARVAFDVGEGPTEAVVTALGDLAFRADFPPGLECGSVAEFRLLAKDTAFTTYADPELGQPGHRATVADAEIELIDDPVESDSGWIVGSADDTAVSGIWVHVNPIGTPAQPESDHSPIGTQCWVTGQGTVGGAIGLADVDGGQTTLITPAYDLSDATAPVVGYWRWYSNAGGSNPHEDVLRVEVSSNEVDWVEVETVGPDGPETLGGWFRHEFAPFDRVAPSSSIRIRFIASDLFGGSIVEAAVDDILIRDRQCLDPGPSFVRGDCRGDGGFELADVITLLDVLFAAGPAGCADACDVDDSGGINVADVVYALVALFESGAPPVSPHPSCGLDPSGSDPLDCAVFPGCP
ncbi:MAG: hypothetical protein KDC38_18760, partial [Planctomycetes bacterium]|nr:hypothetical protein [Planctomycetota bacterium]